MKQLLIKLGLLEDKDGAMPVLEPRFSAASYQPGITTQAFFEQAMKHYCQPCNRWFEKVQGKSMHDRHRHKE